MALKWSTDIGNSILAWMLRQTDMPTAPAAVWLGLNTADPGDDGANELLDANYGRQDVTALFAAPVDKSTASTALLVFPPADDDYTVTHYSLWETESGTEYIGGDELVLPAIVPLGEILEFPLGQIIISAN